MFLLGTIYEQLNDIHYFLNFRADESNYGLHSPNIIYCAHKLNDIYSIYCIARANLHYLDNEDFGDFAKDETAIKFMKTQLIMNALNYYNCLIDLSWQLVWFNIRVDLNDKLMTSKIYAEIAKECNFEVLCYNLSLLKEYKLRDNVLREFFNDKTVVDMRQKWNFLKHRGSFYFEGLGINPSSMNMSFDNMSVPIVNRPVLEIDESRESLIQFDNKFFKYITHIMSIIFPENFSINRDFLGSMVNYLLSNKDQIIVYNQKMNSST